MASKTILRRVMAATALTALALSAAGEAAPARKGATARKPASRMVRVGQPVGTQRPATDVLLSVGEGQMVNLPANAATVWTSNPTVADVFVNSPSQINLFGKSFGEATIFATTASGAVIYSANVRVSQNITSIDQMMRLAMPEANIRVSTAGQIAVLTGTVASPQDSEEAQRLATALLNPGIDISSPGAQLKILVVNRLRMATPLQVNLQVRIAEVSRSFVKNIGVNLTTQDRTGGFLFGVGSGTRSPGTITNTTTGTNYQFTQDRGTAFTSLGLAGRLLGLDILSAIDLGETAGQVTTLANPNLTALSGETASFLAGGEIPIPISQGLGAVSVEYKQYGVSLAYTPTVLADGRISLRVRPEVSQLSAAGAVTIGNVQVPALTTRRAETTVELGSGESFMIAGLLSNNHDNQIEKAPGLGDLPVLGALFRSNGFRRQETELVIVVTPYLVKPTNANQIALPTDGYKAPTDLDRVFLGALSRGTTGGDRPKPAMAQPNGAPSVGAVSPVMPAPAIPAAPRRDEPPAAAAPVKKGKDNKPAGATPGFSFR